MSGIVGIFNRDGAPVDRDVLGRMTDAMIRRGPDAQRIWSDGPVGFGHAALFATLEAERENQPATLDGQVWITADARIDEWDHLRRTLAANGRDIPVDVTDVELILHAYHAWGENCVDHLIGDFAFAIWDARQGRLFCARDHMGVKPFYYYLSDRLFAFASDVGALLANPQVPQRINEGRIADYLVGYLEGIDRTSTFYQEIYRFPQAQCRVIDRQRHTDRTYWALDPTREIRLGSDDEYAAAFLEVFTEAVRARLRAPGRVGSMLSGGLDSSSIVGVARNLLRDGGHGPLHTFSAVAGEADEAAGNTETRCIRAVLAEGGLDAHTIRPGELGAIAADFRGPEQPGDDLFDHGLTIPQAMYILARRAGLKALLDGVDGDLVLGHGDYYLTYLLRQGRWRATRREAAGLSTFYGHWPMPAWKLLLRHGRGALRPSRLLPGPLGAARLARGRGRELERQIAQSGMRPEFAARVGLAERMQTFRDHQGQPRTLKGEHLRRLNHTYLTVGLERYDRVAAAHGMEARHPYVDKRLVAFCLALPWQQLVRRGWSKFVNRTAMAGVLDDTVRWRVPDPDLGPAFIPIRIDLEMTQINTIFTNGATQQLGEYVNIEKIETALQTGIDTASWDDRLFIWKLAALARWLALGDNGL